MKSQSPKTLATCDQLDVVSGGLTFSIGNVDPARGAGFGYESGYGYDAYPFHASSYGHASSAYPHAYQAHPQAYYAQPYPSVYGASYPASFVVDELYALPRYDARYDARANSPATIFANAFAGIVGAITRSF